MVLLKVIRSKTRKTPLNMNVFLWPEWSQQTPSPSGKLQIWVRVQQFFKKNWSSECGWLLGRGCPDVDMLGLAGLGIGFPQRAAMSSCPAHSATASYLNFARTPGVAVGQALHL